MAKNPLRPLDYLVLPLEGLRTVTSGLPTETLGILLQLLIRCATELNSGRIDHAAATTQAPPCNLPGLWHWEGHALVLDIYPADYESKTLAKRINYSSNAATRWEKSPAIQPAPKNTPHAIVSKNACDGMQKTPHLHTPDMQLHKNACNCMQSIMQFPRTHAGDNNRINIKMGGDYAHALARASSAPPDSPLVPTTPPPLNDEHFEKWWRLIAATHPSGRLMRQLPDDILHSARNAYQAIPAAAEYAALLDSYMSSRLQKNKYGERFFRASGVARYFDTLADHINHAERWAVETGYHRKNKPATKPAPPATPPDPPNQHQEQETTAEDIAQFLAEIQQFKDAAAPQHINHEPSDPNHPTA